MNNYNNAGNTGLSADFLSAESKAFSTEVALKEAEENFDKKYAAYREAEYILRQLEGDLGRVSKEHVRENMAASDLDSTQEQKKASQTVRLAVEKKCKGLQKRINTARENFQIAKTNRDRADAIVKNRKEASCG